MDNCIDQYGVRITPKIINFTNCELSNSYIRVVNVQNISAKNLSVRFYPPQSKDFSMVCRTNEKIISSGLSHVCSLKFTMTVEEKYSDRLVITVDGQPIEIPIFIYPSAPKLLITDNINFGTVVMANKVITTSTTIHNEGSKTGEFKIIYDGKKPLNINPYEGFVYPNSSINIQIEFVTREAQIIDEECQVNFEGEEPFTIRVKGEVVRRSLELIDVSEKDQKQVKCIRFNHTYYGSDRSEAALLFNNSPETIDYVAILEEDTVGQESGSHVTMTAGGINPKECTNTLTSLITMFPNQGTLGPYQKVAVLFRFSPRWKWPQQAFKKTLEPPLQQTFAVFVKIQIVGSNVSSTESTSESEQDDLAKCQQLEVALTGTAAPILLDVEPAMLQFDDLIEGDQQKLNAVVYNRSKVLSCHMTFPKEAHFIVEPRSCVISPNSHVDLDVIFLPKQYGNFNTKQMILVQSFVKDESNPFVEKVTTIYELSFMLSGSCTSTVKQVPAKLNPGLDPPITNKVGIIPNDPRFCDLGQSLVTIGNKAAFVTVNGVASGGTAGSDLFRGNDSYLHPYNNRTAYIAYPNDRAESIRPTDQRKEFRTIFKRMKRHNFIDPDYAYTEDERRDRQHHKDKYRSLIRKRNLLRRVAKLNAKFEHYENQQDLGIIPGNYLKSPRLSLDDMAGSNGLDASANNKYKNKFQLLSSKDLKQSENVVDINKLDTFHAIPTTAKEKEHCSQVLTAQQLHQIVIGPSTMNFGDVAIRSSSCVELEVVNNLDMFIHVTVTIDCKELRQSSPLSQVIPAKTKSNFPLVFESGKRGKFQRNLNYLVNGYYHNHVIVLANVVPNQLNLSTDCLILRPSSILPPDAGIRGCVTLTNPLNSPTEFLWEPVFNNSRGIAFSIRPKEGIVEANNQLDCEVTFHPSFIAPNEGDFILRIPANEDYSEVSTTQDTITDGSGAGLPPNSDQLRAALQLRCSASLGSPLVSLQSRRVMFGCIPINLVTSRTAILVNNGTNHAYFRIVSDTLRTDFAGLSISPLKGSISIGGQTEITIKYLPTTLTKFDFAVPVVIRGWKEIELKISGTVIIPHVEIDQKKIEYGGVPVGSKKSISFNLVNTSQCRARVDFDLMKQRDFQVTSDSDEFSTVEGINQFIVMMKPLQTIECQLLFQPSEVASHEFSLQIKVNRIEIAAQESRSQTNISSYTGDIVAVASSSLGHTSSTGKSRQQSKQGITASPLGFDKPLPRPNLIRQVTATAIPQPLSISALKINFQYNSKVETKQTCKQLILHNTINKPIEVCLKLSSANWKFGAEGVKPKRLSKSRSVPFHFKIEQDELASNEDIQLNLNYIGEAAEIKIYFDPDICGEYFGEFPVYINNNFQKPFQHIFLSGFMSQPKLICLPDYLFFTPVPLRTEISVDFKVSAINFECADELDIRLPLVRRPPQLEIASVDSREEKYQPFKLAFATSRDIAPVSADNSKPSSDIWVRLTFNSDIPINIRSYLELATSTGGTRVLGLSAIADNCVLSWLGFFNKHEMNLHIVCDEGKPLEGTEVGKFNSQDYGEAQMKLISHTGAYSTHGGNESNSLHSRNSTTATSSNFEDSSITYEETVTETESMYFGTPVPPREGALNNLGEKGGRHSGIKSNTTSAIKTSFQEAEIQDEEGRSIQTGTSEGIETTSTNGSKALSSSSQIGIIDGSVDGELLVKLVGDRMGVRAESSLLDDDEDVNAFNLDYDMPNGYDKDVMEIMQRWFVMHGWACNINPFSIPMSLRNSLQKRFGYSQANQTSVKKSSDKSKNPVEVSDSPGLKSDSRDLYDMILFLTGKQIVGINTTVALPAHPIERSCHIYVQHATTIAFVENQGGNLAQIMPEYLMDWSEYEAWYANGCPGLSNKEYKPIKYDINNFDKISKKSWTIFLMQMIKCLVLIRVTIKTYRQSLQQLHLKKSFPDVQMDPLASNCYSLQERILLVWLNHLYDTHRHIVWSNQNQVPSARWIINFDNDFMDSVILATAIGAFVPNMIQTHFRLMYTNPENPEQFLNNALKIVSALNDIGMEFDINAIDIVDPNPIMMLLLTMHLFQNLHLYVPKSEITFIGSLHEEVTKNIQLSNPTSKVLTYECKVIGQDSQDFSTPKGAIVNLSAKSSIKWPIVFKSRFIRPAEAIIMFVGRKTGAIIPTNLIFRVKSKSQSNIPLKTEKVSEKCYKMKKIELKVVNPYNESGQFSVKLIESFEGKLKEPEVKIPGQINIKNKKQSSDGIKLENRLRAFTTHTKTIFIDKATPAILEIFYMPMNMSPKTCQIIFSNSQIGEFVQSVEATALLPEPIPIESNKSNNKIRVSSAEAAKRGLEGNDKFIYWKCEVGSHVNEVLNIPVRNKYKEQALLIAAQHHLSAEEVGRRQVTGTLNSNSLLLTAVQMLTLHKNHHLPNNSLDAQQLQQQQTKKATDTKYTNKGNVMEFEVELDSSYFKGPSRIQIPDPLHNLQSDNSDKKSEAGGGGGAHVDLPIAFQASQAGVYACNVVLRSSDDVRVHRIECTVTPEGHSAKLLFHTPLQDAVIQQLPIVNKTNQDWPLRATFHGGAPSFTGPDYIVAKALTVSQYALQFRPTKEGVVKGKLSLLNEADGTEHIYELIGEGESPLALELLQFDCTVGEKVSRVLHIPNATRKKHVFFVESDLDWMVTGTESVAVLPNRSTPYELFINPRKSGTFKGIVAFVSGKKFITELDSDGEEIPDVYEEDYDPNTGEPVSKDNKSSNNGEGKGIYRIWYSLIVEVKPGPPKSELIIDCPCLQSRLIEIPLNNPLSNCSMNIDINIVGRNLHGESNCIVAPLSSSIYRLTYTPTVKGSFESKIIFYEENVGEFWYRLSLNSTSPEDVTVDDVSCELGRWSIVEIPLKNLDDEFDLVFSPTISNSDCFSIYWNETSDWYNAELKSFILTPLSSRILKLKFTPCEIGSSVHSCILLLNSQTLGEWKFHLSGTGLPPFPYDVVGITSEAGSNRTILIPFHNPMLEPVLVDISISEEHQGVIDRYRLAAGDTEAFTAGLNTTADIFRLLLKNNRKLKLLAKQSMEIPISFAPQEMRRYDAICSVILRKKTGKALMTDEEFNDLVIPRTEVPMAYDKYTLRWLFPIKGIPEASIPENISTTPLVQGPLRIQTQERLQFKLWGLPPPLNTEDLNTKLTKSAPADHKTSGSVPLEPLLQDFSIRLQVTSTENNQQQYTNDNERNLMIQEILNDSLQCNLLRQEKVVENGLTILHYEFLFKPMKKFKLNAEAVITSASGAVWKFPVKFIAHESQPDDEIQLEAIQLNRPVCAKFFLNSQTFEPVPFQAYFQKGGDPNFTVSPMSGILPSVTSNEEPCSGLPFVVTWTPNSYGMCKGATLVIETQSMEWTYFIKGIGPRFQLPHSNSIIKTTWTPVELEKHQRLIRRRAGKQDVDEDNAEFAGNQFIKPPNFIRQNIELISTAVSSPIKGAPLFPKVIQ